MAGNKLLVVIDPLTDDQIALNRAVRLALDINASLHLFCCTHLADDELLEFATQQEAKNSQLEETKSWLEELAEPIKAQGINVSIEVIWHQNWERMVTQSAGRFGATLIVKSSFQHSPISRKLSRTSDFHVMRTAPCPVLLVKSDEAWQNGILLAAVSLCDKEPEHDLLNNKIFAQASRLAQAANLELHLVSAVEKTSNLAKLFHRQDQETLSNQAMAAQRFGIRSANLHLREGHAKTVISEISQELHADVLVIGTTARAGVNALLIGNTAEKLLDDIEIDVLVVG